MLGKFDLRVVLNISQNAGKVNPALPKAGSSVSKSSEFRVQGSELKGRVKDT